MKKAKRLTALLLTAVLSFSSVCFTFAFEENKPYIKVNNKTGVASDLTFSELKRYKNTDYYTYKDEGDGDYSVSYSYETAIDGYKIYEPTEYVRKSELASILTEKAAEYNPDFNASEFTEQAKDKAPVTLGEALEMIGKAFSNMPEPKGANAAAIPDEKAYTAYNLPEDENTQRMMRCGVYPMFDNTYQYVSESEYEDLKGGYLEYLENLKEENPEFEILDYNKVKDDIIGESFVYETLNLIYRLYGSQPKDDLYTYANKDYLDTLELKELDEKEFSKLYSESDSSATDALEDYYTSKIDKLDSNNHKKARQIILDVVRGDGYEPSSKEQKIKDYYNSILNTYARSSLGIKPIEDYLNSVDNAKTVDELYNYCLSQNAEHTLPFFTFSVTVDTDDLQKKNIGIAPFDSGISALTSLDTTIEDYTRDYLCSLFELGGSSKEQAQKETEAIISVSEKVSTGYSFFAGEQYNLTLEQLQKYFKGIDLNKTAKAQGYSLDVNQIYTQNLEGLKAISTLFKDEKLDELKAIAKFQCLVTCSEYLSPEFKSLNDDFENKVTDFISSSMDDYLSSWLSESTTEETTGEAATEETTQQVTELDGSVLSEDEAAALDETIDVFQDYVNRLYCAEYLNQETVDYVSSLTDDIVAAYKKRLENNDWLSSETKAAAIKKLDNIKIVVGQNRTGKLYLDDAVILDTDSSGYYDNIVSIHKAMAKSVIEAQSKGVTPDDVNIEHYWGNAAYMPAINTIFIPAGILQDKTVFDISASYEENLGGIGFVIGHEISHAFDITGSQRDENGAVNDWWTDEDREAFYDKCDELIESRDMYPLANTVYQNSSATVDEDIADLGGMAVTLDIMSGLKNPDYEAYYSRFAQNFAFGATGNLLNYLTYADHSLGIRRVNPCASSFDVFYSVYDVDNNDGMYLSKDKRITIW